MNHQSRQYLHKKQQNIIQENNFLIAAQLLLDMDVSAIDEKYQFNALTGVMALKQTFLHFQAQQHAQEQQQNTDAYPDLEKTDSLQAVFIRAYQRYDAYKKSLFALLQSTRDCFPLLTPEAKEALQQNLIAWEMNRGNRENN